VRNAEFNDPRLTEIYDAEFVWSRADDYFVSLVNERPVARVLDVGCGTGRLALGLAALGHIVTGVDPAQASLAAARAKAGADRITWLEGTARSAPAAAFDIALMTGHVAQSFVDDDEWAGTLSELRRALVQGGRLAFDARDPGARAWERWNPQDSRVRINLSDDRAVVVWTEVTEVQDDIVTFTSHYRLANGEETRPCRHLFFNYTYSLLVHHHS
jgi:SAM-dependent methyltransferase